MLPRLQQKASASISDVKCISGTAASTAKSDTGGQGLRPLIRRNKTKGSTTGPLDRLSQHLLDWDILDAVGKVNPNKNVDVEYEQPPPEVSDKLPDVYRTYEDYINAWEPMMIKDIQDSIVSRFSTNADAALAGQLVCTAGGNRSEGGGKVPLTALECTFFLGRANRKNDHGESSRPQQLFPTVMDLLLITLEPLDISARSTSVSPIDPGSFGTLDPEKIKLQQGRVILGLVVSSAANTDKSTGPRVYQVNVLSQHWDQLRQRFKDAHMNVFAPSGRNLAGIGSIGSIGPPQSSTQRATVKSFQLCYTVLESVRSSWREFQAVHDIGQNVPLMAEILGAERTFVMATTPPHVSGTQDSPFDLSHSPVDTSSSGSSCSAAVGSSDRTHHPGELSPALSRQTSAASSQAAPEVPDNTARADETARLQNRMVVVNSLVGGWKMKGCTEKFMRYLHLKYNPSQLHAIHTAVEQQGFTLVQGPPGTGKTSTILGILNAIHIREFNQYYKLALEALLGPEGHKCRQQTYEHPWLTLVARLTAIKPRILVVAPSNTAVDNIILRVMESGFVDGNGGKYFPNILRIGAGSKNAKVKSVSVEELVDREVALVDGTTDRHEMMEKLSGQVTAMITEIAFLQSMLVNLQLAYAQCNPLPTNFELRVDQKTGQPYWVDHHCKSTTLNAPTAKVLEARGAGTTYPTIETLPDYILYSHRLTQLVTAIDAASTKRKQISNMTEMKSSYNLRVAAERSVIDGAHILFATLNSVGHPSMESSEFCVTVVDEAAQSTEPSVLIALRRGCRQCVMVGDQQQLTATVFSPQARAARYDRSLFQRLVETGHPYIMLDTQYRMAPDISAFPCQTFYKGQLKNGENVLQPAYLPPFLRSAGAGDLPLSAPRKIFSSFMFLDLQSSCERQGRSGSQSNAEEAKLCFVLLRALQQAGRQAGCQTIGSVGVITFYSDQVLELNRVMLATAFSPEGGECAVRDFEMNTVDGFQGKEKDIIIISAVRANDRASVGFTSDLRRLNVGLTRARKGLFVIGHAPTLSNDATWRSLLHQACNSGSLFSVRDSKCDLARVLSSSGSRNETPQPARESPGQGTFAPCQPPHPPALAAAQRPQEVAPVADTASGRIVVSSGAVGWVRGSSNNLHEASSASLMCRCGDQDYGLVDKLTSVTHAIHKRKLQEVSPEEGELEE